LSEPKTKVAKAALDKLGLKHALIVIGESDAKFHRAARNLAAHKVLAVEGLNVYDVLNYQELVMTTSTAKAIEARFSGEAK
jgi:large subunit ribosomal protein L4